MVATPDTWRGLCQSCRHVPCCRDPAFIFEGGCLFGKVRSHANSASEFQESCGEPLKRQMHGFARTTTARKSAYTMWMLLRRLA